MKLTGSASSLRQAKRLRDELTLPEILLWRELRKLDVRIRKQAPAGPYVLDFYCAKACLAIEVDGEAHDRGDRQDRDVRRDGWLATQGVMTLRIRASDVLGDLDAVMRLIVATIETRLHSGSTRNDASP